MEDLVVYKEILEAIKISKANVDLESDMNNINLNEINLEKQLINDTEIQEKAKEKVYKNHGNRRE